MCLSGANPVIYTLICSRDMSQHTDSWTISQVDECLALWKKTRIPASSRSANPRYRCVVCTLPHGACKHNKQWLECRSRRPILDALAKDNIDLMMDDITDLLAPAADIQRYSTPKARIPSLSHLRWETLRAQPADELAGKKIDLSSPSCRAGHTMVVVDGAGSLQEDTRLIVLFGGVSNAKRERPIHAPDAGAVDDDDRKRDVNLTHEDDGAGHSMCYYAGIHVFSVGLGTWHCPQVSGDLPDGRYGHVSLALNNETMWMFGGRLQGGRQASDTFLLDVRAMKWRKTQSADDGKGGPSARVWSAAVKVLDRVILFGGADVLGGRILDDVWTWNVQSERWEEQIVVGSPPLARYGHALLACPDRQVIVLGGCCVSPAAEDGLPLDYDELQLRVRVAAGDVSRAYRLEEAEVDAEALVRSAEAGYFLRDQYRGGFSSVKGRWRKSLARRQAQVAANIAARERHTASMEENLRTILDERAAMTHWAKLRSRHPVDRVDVTYLDTKSMIWGVLNPPPISGGASKPPAARMHFCASVVGGKVVLWGGCLPTSREVKCAEGGVNVYDLVHRRWSAPVGKSHEEGIQPDVDAAIGQLRRAERALHEAKQRAMTMGAPGGRTLQVVQAEARITVNQWRVTTLKEKLLSAIPLPQPRASHAGCVLGHRVMYFGGWGAREEKGAFVVLDIEQPHEKERRLDDEFHFRLERERQTREADELATLRRSALQEEMRKYIELASEAAETASMSAEDARSAIPELTTAPTPRLRCANSTTLWVEWDRPATDTIGRPLNGQVEYTLYMRGGFRQWGVGDRVLVAYMNKAQRKAAAFNGSQSLTCSVTDTCSKSEGTPAFREEWRESNGLPPAAHSQGGRVVDCTLGNEHDTLFDTINRGGSGIPDAILRNTASHLLPAVITDASAGDGVFDIRWNDGQLEVGVRRHRIHRLEPPTPPWTVVYNGHDCCYAVEGMIPESVIQREREFRHETGADFALQTRGTEIPREKPSRHSQVVNLRTSFDGQGPRGEVGELGNIEKTAGIKARLTTAKELDDSIAEAGEMRVASCEIHRLHGQYVAAGRGRSYL